MPVPPPLPFPDRFFKLPRVRPRPLQKRILQYLNEGRNSSVNAVSEDLGVSRFSARRALTTMRSRGLVNDQPGFFANCVVPGIRAHGLSITNSGRRELKFLQSIPDNSDSSPLGYRILLCLMHGNPMTIGPIAKATSSLEGHVRRVMKSLQNKGLVECLYSQRRTSLGDDLITHLYRTTDLGRKVLDAGPAAYLRTVRRPTDRLNKAPKSRQMN